MAVIFPVLNGKKEKTAKKSGTEIEYKKNFSIFYAEKKSLKSLKFKG